MADISKTRRQNLIFQMLKGLDEQSGLSPQAILKKLENENIEVNLRTVRRDLTELSSTHGLCSTETRPERFYASKDFELKHELHLNEPTLQALMIALNNLKFTSHQYFKNITTEAETAILDSLDPELAKELRDSKNRYHFDFSSAGKPNDSDIKEFELIMRAIRENRVITCLNKSPYQPDEYNERRRTFAPYVFILSAGIPYLLAQDLDQKELKTLRITRLSAVELSDERFERENSEGLPNFENLIGGWGAANSTPVEFKIVCDKLMATYFEERAIHASQKLRSIGNGNYEITFKCAHSKELPRLIASFGGCVKAVEPASLFEEVKEVWASGLKNVA